MSHMQKITPVVYVLTELRKSRCQTILVDDKDDRARFTDSTLSQLITETELTRDNTVI